VQVLEHLLKRKPGESPLNLARLSKLLRADAVCPPADGRCSSGGRCRACPPRDPRQSAAGCCKSRPSRRRGTDTVSHITAYEAEHLLKRKPGESPLNLARLSKLLRAEGRLTLRAPKKWPRIKSLSFCFETACKFWNSCIAGTSRRTRRNTYSSASRVSRRSILLGSVSCCVLTPPRDPRQSAAGCCKSRPSRRRGTDRAKWRGWYCRGHGVRGGTLTQAQAG
jgi:hypothetical protein